MKQRVIFVCGGVGCVAPEKTCNAKRSVWTTYLAELPEGLIIELLEEVGEIPVRACVCVCCVCGSGGKIESTCEPTRKDRTVFFFFNAGARLTD